MSACRTCIGLDCDDGPTLGTYSLQRVILPEVISAGSGSLSLAALGISNGCLGTALSANIVATGRSANSRTTWSILSGSLPLGLTLTPHGNYATVSGTPTATGTNSFTVLATGSDGTQATRQYSLPIYLTCTAGDYGDLYDIQSIAYSPNQQTFLVTGYTQGAATSKVYVYDPVDDIVTNNPTIGGGTAEIDSPPAYSPSEDKFYLYDPVAVLVYVIAANGSVINTIDVSSALGTHSTTNFGPRDVAVGTDRFYVGSRSSAGTPNARTATAVLLSTQAVAASVDLTALGYTNNDMQLCFSPADGKLYVGAQSTAGLFPEKLIRLHGTTLAFEAELEIYPDAHANWPIAYCPENKCVYVTYSDALVKVVDVDPLSGTYFTVVATIDLSDSGVNSEPDIVYAEGPNKMVVSVLAPAGVTKIYTISPATNLVTATVSISPDCGVIHIAWDPDQDKVFMTNNIASTPQIFGRSIT